MKIEMDMPALTEGWKYTGEYRKARDGEHFLLDCGSDNAVISLYSGTECSGYRYHIVKKERWRAEEGFPYFYVSGMSNVLAVEDNRAYLSNKLWNAGNYFQTEEQAQHAAKKIKKLLMELHNVSD